MRSQYNSSRSKNTQVELNWNENPQFPNFLRKQRKIRERGKGTRTWVGRMAVSRAERRWSKEPRIETTSSVMVWLFCSDSFIFAAFSLSGSTQATAIPIFFFWSVWFLRRSPKTELRRLRRLEATATLLNYCIVTTMMVAWPHQASFETNVGFGELVDIPVDRVSFFLLFVGFQFLTKTLFLVI